MKLVTFGKAMAPHGVGDTRLVSDDVAKQLDRDGMISDSQSWPAPEKPRRPTGKPERPTGVPDSRIAR